MKLLEWIVLVFVGIWFVFLVITVGFCIHPAVLGRVNLLENRDDPDSIDSRVSSYSTTYASTLTTPTSEYTTTADAHHTTTDSEIHRGSLNYTEATATTYSSTHTTPSSEYTTTADAHTTTDSKIHRGSLNDTEAVGASDTLSKGFVCVHAYACVCHFT